MAIVVLAVVIIFFLDNLREERDFSAPDYTVTHCRFELSRGAKSLEKH